MMYKSCAEWWVLSYSLKECGCVCVCASWIITDFLCVCACAFQLLDNVENKMKGTCVEGTIPKLFRGKMVVCFLSLYLYSFLVFMVMATFCGVIIKFISLPRLKSLKDNFLVRCMLFICWRPRFSDLFCAVMPAQHSLCKCCCRFCSYSDDVK